MMEYDFAIIYFGLTRSVKKTHESHTKHVFDVLKREKLSYKTFMHTWKTKDGTQNVWQNIIPEKIDYTEHLLLSPDFYTIDDENEETSRAGSKWFPDEDEKLVKEITPVVGKFWDDNLIYKDDIFLMLLSNKIYEKRIKHSSDEMEKFKEIMKSL
jgi:hypothetical protein